MVVQSEIIRSLPMQYPKGYPVGKDKTKIAVTFPTGLFHTIIARAAKEGKTFNAMVVELVRVGELDLSESDRHDLAA
jgi:hypothetical protein